MKWTNLSTNIYKFVSSTQRTNEMLTRDSHYIRTNLSRMEASTLQVTHKLIV